MEIPAELLARIAQEASLECRAKDAYIEFLSRDLAEVTRQRDELLRQLEELTAPPLAETPVTEPEAELLAGTAAVLLQVALRESPNGSQSPGLSEPPRSGGRRQAGPIHSETEDHPMPDYRDRNDHYVPDGLNPDAAPQYAEIGLSRDPATGERVPERAQVAHGLADELNRERHSWWADVSRNGSHWAWFNGHRIQIDLTFSTANWREINSWKGRDEIRPAGEWKLSLNRQPCWEGQIGSDPLTTLRDIPRIIERLINHDALDWNCARTIAQQLAGRRIYYDRTPAVVAETHVLEQGCVLVRPVGMEEFPPSVYDLDKPEDQWHDERDQYKVDLLDPKIWWWRDRLHDSEKASS